MLKDMPCCRLRSPNNPSFLTVITLEINILDLHHFNSNHHPFRFPHVPLYFSENGGPKLMDFDFLNQMPLF